MPRIISLNFRGKLNIFGHRPNIAKVIEWKNSLTSIKAIFLNSNFFYLKITLVAYYDHILNTFVYNKYIQIHKNTSRSNNVFVELSYYGTQLLLKQGDL